MTIFCHVLHTTYRFIRQVHFDESLLHKRFPASVALYDGSLERDLA